MTRRHTLKRLLPLLAAAALSVAAQKTTRRQLKFDPPAYDAPVVDTAAPSAPDTLLLPGASLRLYGYEKPLRSSKESLHLNNMSDHTISVIRLDISYLDYKGQELHRRTVDIDCHLPPGATRLLTFPSWDVQKRFYYADGPRPRNQAYPYRVKMTVLHAIIDQTYRQPENSFE